jgi:hypothetical protein
MTFILDTSTLAAESDSVTRQRLTGFGRWFQIKISHDSANPLKLLGFVLYYVLAGERRVK